MTARALAAPLLAVSLALPACRERTAPPPTHVELRGDVARVGDVVIPRPLLVQVASARGVAAGDALQGLIADALLAREAETTTLAAEPRSKWAFESALARAAAERLAGEARAEGAPTEIELGWVRASHAVVLRSSVLSLSLALEVAGSLRQIATSARSDGDFLSRARQLAHPGALVTVQDLPEFDVAGRAVDGQQFDPIFVAAAFALRSPGDVSDIVESPFGWHVIRLVERRAPDAETLAKRRLELADAAVQARVRERLSAAIRAMGRAHPVDVSVGADALMAQAVAPDP